MFFWARVTIVCSCEKRYDMYSGQKLNWVVENVICRGFQGNDLVSMKFIKNSKVYFCAKQIWKMLRQFFVFRQYNNLTCRSN